MMRATAALMLAALAAAPGPASAPASAQREVFTVDDLKQVEADRDAAEQRLRALKRSSRTVEREMADIDADLLAAAADSRRREEAAAAAEARLADLEIDVGEARRRLTADRADLDDLLAALMTLGARRPPALAASPENASDAVRAAILMGDAAPELARRSDELALRIGELNRLIDRARRERRQIDAAEAALAARRREIEALAAEKSLSRTAFAAETDALATETARLGREARTLRELLDRLEAAAPSRPSRKPTTAAAATPPRGTPATRPAPAAAPSASGVRPTSPVLGRVTLRYGETGAGGVAQGLTLATRAGAQVVSPLDARVEYAGAFRSYGDVLILDVGDDYLVVLAGLDAIYAGTGQWVLAGEPVGRMADRASPPPELYLEVRRSGEPVDPARWIDPGAGRARTGRG